MGRHALPEVPVPPAVLEQLPGKVEQYRKLIAAGVGGVVGLLANLTALGIDVPPGWLAWINLGTAVLIAAGVGVVQNAPTQRQAGQVLAAQIVADADGDGVPDRP